VVFGLHFLKRMGDRLGFQQLKTCTLSAKPIHLHSDTEPQPGNGAATARERWYMSLPFSKPLIPPLPHGRGSVLC
jgi:hypothetical protein